MCGLSYLQQSHVNLFIYSLEVLEGERFACGWVRGGKKLDERNCVEVERLRWNASVRRTQQQLPDGPRQRGLHQSLLDQRLAEESAKKSKIFQVQLWTQRCEVEYKRETHENAGLAGREGQGYH